jgi:hypothetical protein
MIPSGLVQHAHKLKYLVNSNATTILTSVGVTGTVATAYLAARASFKAADILAQDQKKREEDLKFPEVAIKELTKIDKAKLVWPHYIPAVGVGALTVTSIVMAHRISSTKIAALAVASSLSDRALNEYKAKVVEKIGERKETDIRDEIAQDRVLQHSPSRQIVVSNATDVLCYDMTTDRYFHSTVEKIKKAEIACGFEILHYDTCSLSRFYDDIDLQPTSFSDTVGWNVNHKLELDLSTVLTDDGRPCITIGFKKLPISDYLNVWGG